MRVPAADHDGVSLPRQATLLSLGAFLLVYGVYMLRDVRVTEVIGRAWAPVAGFVGGALVPLTDDLLYADLFARWGAPVVLVARTQLGTINHSLLSLEALRARGVPVAATAEPSFLRAASTPTVVGMRRSRGRPAWGWQQFAASLLIVSLGGLAMQSEQDTKVV